MSEVPRVTTEEELRKIGKGRRGVRASVVPTNTLGSRFTNTVHPFISNKNK